MSAEQFQRLDDTATVAQTPRDDVLDGPAEGELPCRSHPSDRVNDDDGEEKEEESESGERARASASECEASEPNQPSEEHHGGVHGPGQTAHEGTDGPHQEHHERAPDSRPASNPLGTGALYSTRRPRNVLSGIGSGSKNLGRGLAAGTASLVSMPVAGARSGGVAGALSGLGLGALAFTALSLGGVATCGVQLVHGMWNTPLAIKEAMAGTKVWNIRSREWIEVHLATSHDALPANDDDLLAAARVRAITRTSQLQLRLEDVHVEDVQTPAEKYDESSEKEPGNHAAEHHDEENLKRSSSTSNRNDSSPEHVSADVRSVRENEDLQPPSRDPTPDFYEMLCVSRTATTAEIKAAYIRALQTPAEEFHQGSEKEPLGDGPTNHAAAGGHAAGVKCASHTYEPDSSSTEAARTSDSATNSPESAEAQQTSSSKTESQQRPTTSTEALQSPPETTEAKTPSLNAESPQQYGTEETSGKNSEPLQHSNTEAAAGENTRSVLSDPAQFRRVTEAFKVLINPVLRAEYDFSGRVAAIHKCELQVSIGGAAFLPFIGPLALSIDGLEPSTEPQSTTLTSADASSKTSPGQPPPLPLPLPSDRYAFTESERVAWYKRRDIRCAFYLACLLDSAAVYGFVRPVDVTDGAVDASSGEPAVAATEAVPDAVVVTEPMPDEHHDGNESETTAERSSPGAVDEVHSSPHDACPVEEDTAGLSFVGPHGQPPLPSQVEEEEKSSAARAAMEQREREFLEEHAPLACPVASEETRHDTFAPATPCTSEPDGDTTAEEMPDRYTEAEAFDPWSPITCAPTDAAAQPSPSALFLLHEAASELRSAPAAPDLCRVLATYYAAVANQWIGGSSGSVVTRALSAAAHAGHRVHVGLSSLVVPWILATQSHSTSAQGSSGFGVHENDIANTAAMSAELALYDEDVDVEVRAARAKLLLHFSNMLLP